MPLIDLFARKKLKIHPVKCILLLMISREASSNHAVLNVWFNSYLPQSPGKCAMW